MNKYVDQLLGDLQAAQGIKIAPPYLELDEDMECMRGTEEFLYGTLSTMEQLFGIEKICFPPIEKLTAEKARQLVEEILNLYLGCRRFQRKTMYLITI